MQPEPDAPPWMLLWCLESGIEAVQWCEAHEWLVVPGLVFLGCMIVLHCALRKAEGGRRKRN